MVKNKAAGYSNFEPILRIFFAVNLSSLVEWDYHFLPFAFSHLLPKMKGWKYAGR
jgi:hypothetical protein